MKKEIIEFCFHLQSSFKNDPEGDYYDLDGPIVFSFRQYLRKNKKIQENPIVKQFLVISDPETNELVDPNQKTYYELDAEICDRLIFFLSEHLQSPKPNKKLKLFNGGDNYFKSSFNDLGHLYVAAYSQQDAVNLINQTYRKLKKLEDRLDVNPCGLSEIRNYYSKNCWGNAMDGVTPERGIWRVSEREGNSSRVRLA
jgi:hypothetical protein